MNKLNTHLLNLSQSNINRLRKKIQGLSTEAGCENGKVKLVVDLDKLR